MKGSLVNKENKDRLFKFIFGRPEKKEWLLSLYNAVNHSHYDNPDDITVTTIEDSAFAYFQQQGLFTRAVSMKFRTTFLERGGSEEPMVLYEMFRGAPPTPDALLRARGLTE